MMDRIYLDNNATTCPAPEVVAAMHEAAELLWANPSSIHRFGQAVRQRVSEQIGLKARDVVVLNPGSLPKTSSGKLQRRKTAELYLAEELVDSPTRTSRLGLVRDVASSQLGYMRSYLADRIGIR